MRAAPTEEYTLLCDIPGCETGVAMVAGIPRSRHGWGRLSVYGNGVYDGPATDYDLCAEHYKQVMVVLRGES